MPIRRPSASVGYISSTAAPSRAHKSSESQHGLIGNGITQSSHSMLYSSALGTPQQKVVQVLVNRLKNKLPCNSGLSLDRLEADNPTQQAVEALVDLGHDSLDLIAWALSEQLERLAKQTDSNGLLSIEVLQSQLFILKVLTVAMASRWSYREPRTSSRASNGAGPDSPRPSVSAKRSYHSPSEHSTTPPPWLEPPPLDDNCARYILSVMVLFLRQTAPLENRLTSISSADTTFRDYESLDLPVDAINIVSPPPYVHDVHEPILRTQRSSTSVGSGTISVNSTIPAPSHELKYEKTHISLVKSTISLNALISKFTGRIVYHLSASNWPVVFNRLRVKIRFLADTPEDNPDTVDLHLMAHSALDRHRLIQVLNELSSLLVNMKKEAQAAVAIPLRTAVWNWIDVFPAEFNDVIRSRGRMEGAPERVFDLLYSTNQVGSEKVIWPTLTILNCITSDRLSTDFQVKHFGYSNHGGQKGHRKDSRFVEDLIKHANTTSKLADVAIVCALDMCRAATHVRPEGELPLRIIASDLAHEIKSALLTNHSQKPFWEGTEEIDVAIHAEALVTVYRFLPDQESLPLFTTCLEPERSEAVKTVAVKACLTLVLEARRLPWQKSLETLENALALRLRKIFKTAAVRRNEVDQYGSVKRVASRPKAKRFASEPLSDREVLLLGILSLWRAGAPFFWNEMDISEIDQWMAASIKLWEAPVDNSIKISTACSFKMLAEIAFKSQPDYPFHDITVAWMKRALSATLVSVVTNLIHCRTNSEGQQLWIVIAHQILELFLRKTDESHVKEIQLSPSRLPAFALAEIAFLVSLTSADSGVSHLAAKGLRVLAQAERQSGAPTRGDSNEENLSKRNPIYEQLGDPTVMVVGRVGHQKRVRKLVRLFAYPSATHIAVWQECYWRWRLLSETVIEAIPEDDIATHRNAFSVTWEENRFQWRNLTLFLAAFGGACVQDDQETTSLTSLIPSHYLPDEMRVLQNPANLVETFVKDLTNLLVAESTQIRDVAREALGSELSPRLYSRLLKHLDEVIHSITQGAGSELTDSYSLFLDQFIAVLKLLVENAYVPVDESLSIDMSSTLLVLAGFIARFNTPLSHRLKIKFCALSDCVCDRGESLTLRKDSSSRASILDIITDWIQDTASAEDGDLLQNQELNMACLRTAVKLLDRLQLKPPEGSASDDTVHVVSRLFIRYSNVLLKGLDVCELDSLTSDAVSDVPSLQQKMRASQRETELRELVITGLAHLVSANTESGFKHCLPLAYEKDLRKRTIFAHVFARVLGQGTKFEAKDNVATTSGQNRLCELVKGSDMVLAMAICETCTPAEVDIMISVLMNLFDTRPSLMALMKLMIDREIAHTENEAALFRGNSTCTRFLSAFAKIHGYNYLRSLIIPLIKTMASMPPGHGYELDPNKAGNQDIEQNQRNVEVVASSFLEIVSSSVPAIPSMFREICAHIAKAVNDVWPEAKFAALGAFIFLRFISPAVVAPETVDVEVPKENGLVIRRGLMVIAKIIQNLANNIFFGKEQHMVSLNEFLERNIINVTRFLSEVNKHSAVASEDEADGWLGTTSDDTDSIVLHRFFDKHADKIGKELLSLSKPSNEGDPSAISGKLAWDALCAALVDLKQPPEVPKLSNLNRQNHREYQNLMNRYAHRSVEQVKAIFVETSPTPKEQPAVFVLHVSKIDVEAMDTELLMFYIFKTLTSPQYEYRDFEIILDCTAFTSISEVPLQWVKYCTELIPMDIRQRFMTTYILNPNALTQRYLRRLYNISAGAPFSGEIRAFSSVAELMEHVQPGANLPLVYATDLEHEPHEEFREVTMRQVHQIRMPVTVDLGATHMRITSVKAQPISPLLSCRSTEIIYFADISDIYNVSTGHDPYEFIIRRPRQGITLYFSSPLRDSIIKTIRSAKSHMRDSQPPATERFSRFANVPATLLHVGMRSIDMDDEELRSAAYDLLGAVCSYLNYDKNPIVASKAGFIPGDPSTFAVQLSERLAEFAPEMTLDFISEVSAGMENTKTAQRISALQYMGPWVKNLAHFPNPTSSHYEHSGARLRDCVRVLSELTIADPEISSTIQKYVWSEIGKLDSIVVNAVLEELIRAAIDGGIGSKRCETAARIVAAMSSINVRGRLFSRLRKALGKTAMKPSKSLDDNAHWGEIAAIIRLILVAGNSSRQTNQNQLYVPEIVHLVTLVAATGDTIVRKSVYGIIMNLLQSLYNTRSEDVTGPELLLVINECTRAETLQLFGLQRATATSEYSNFEPSNDKQRIDLQESLTQLLARIMETTAGSQGLLNVWRARWMSLVTSMAFQLSAAIQTRAFIALGTLATSDVDDDLLYQMLVAFKIALSQSNETNTTSVVSMLRCICKIVPSLTDNSRYISQLFWLAVALIESSHVSFYAEANNLLCVTLENLEARGMFRKRSVSAFLLEARGPLEDIACQLDQLLALSFESSFSFSLASIIFKGVRHGMKDSAERVLRSLLRVTIRTHVKLREGQEDAGDVLLADALGYFLALLPLSTTPKTYRQLLEDCNANQTWLAEAGSGAMDPDAGVPQVHVEYIGVNDDVTALLVTSFIGSMLTTAQGHDAETEILYTLLAEVAMVYPETVAMTYDGLQERIKDSFANSSNASIIKAVSVIFRVALLDPGRAGTPRGSASTLSTVDETSLHGPGKNHVMALERLGMQGLASSFQFLPNNRGQATTMINWISELVVRIIE